MIKCIGTSSGPREEDNIHGVVADITEWFEEVDTEDADVAPCIEVSQYDRMVMVKYCHGWDDDADSVWTYLCESEEDAVALHQLLEGLNS